LVRPLACSRFESSTSLSSGGRNSASLRRCELSVGVQPYEM
jgi:hypothetical protein